MTMLEIKPDEPLFVISVAAKLSGLHIQTLRLYEKRGVVVPKRTHKNTRLYSFNDIKKLKIIKVLVKDRGLRVEQVVRILEAEKDLNKLMKKYGIR
ncbi:MerR family transcriptional regulator [Thermococci archaeon]|nr:MAG: MerR family transcriptional regulator [Thermococci archaeon]